MNTIVSPERKMQRQLALLSVLTLAFGLLFVINPALSLDIVTTVSAIVLFIIGALQTFAFFQARFEDRLLGNQLAIAFIAFALGAFLLAQKNTITMAITLVSAAVFFFHGGLHLQFTLISYRSRVRNWWLMFLFSLIALIGGVYALVQMSQLDLYVRILGIFMLAVALMDAYTLLYMRVVEKAHHALQQQNPPSLVE